MDRAFYWTNSFCQAAAPVALAPWGKTSMRCVVRLLAMTFFTLAGLQMGLAQAEKRVALVIGNSNYQHTRVLPNPKNDAEAIAKLLLENGFAEVRLEIDVGYAAMRDVMRAFGETARAADVALVYYAGHGFELAGENYLVPIDAKLARDVDLEFETVTLASTLNLMTGARKLRLVILDACRNNPLGERIALRSGVTRSVPRGLARIEPAGDVLVAFAAKAGTLAEDGAERHSPYAEALLKYIPTPGLDVRLMFGKVRDHVLTATSQRQEPFTYGSLSGEVLTLVPGPAPTNDRELELTFWASVKDSSSPGVLATYLARYPNGTFASAARALIEHYTSQLKADKGKQPEKVADATKPRPSSWQGWQIVPQVGAPSRTIRIALSPDARAILVQGDGAGGWTGSVQVWAGTGQLLHSSHGGAFAPGGRWLIRAAASDVGKLEVRDWASVSPHVRTLDGDINFLSTTADGRWLATAGYPLYDTTKVWDLETGHLVGAIKGLKRDPRVFQLSHDARWIATADGATIDLWEVATGHSLKLRAHENIQSLALSPDGRYLAGVEYNGSSIRIWETATGKALHTLKKRSGGRLAFSPDSRWLSTSGGGADVSIWEVATGKLLHAFEEGEHIAHWLAFTPNGRWLMAGRGGDAKRIDVWDAASGRLLRQLHDTRQDLLWDGGQYALPSAISSDGRWLATCGTDCGIIRLWELATGRIVRSLYADPKTIAAVAMSVDKSRLVSASDDGSIRIWETTTGRLTHTLEGHTKTVRTLSISPDGRHVLSAGAEGSVKIWQATTGQLLHTLKGHSEHVTSITMTSSGRLIVTGDWDEMVKIWDVASGRLVRTLKGHKSFVRHVVMTPDQQAIVSFADDGFKRWDLASGKLLKALKSDEVLIEGLGNHGSSRTLPHFDSTIVLSRDGDWRESALVHLTVLPGGHWVTISVDGLTYTGSEGVEQHLLLTKGLETRRLDDEFRRQHFKPSGLDIRLAKR